MGATIKSDFLFSSPSLLSGAARLFDWSGSFDQYNTSPDAEEADQRALSADWTIVGYDLWNAMETFEQLLPA